MDKDIRTDHEYGMERANPKLVAVEYDSPLP
jgi:hypothetical protein